MASSSKGQGQAPAATVEAGQMAPPSQQAYLDQIADDAERAVAAIEEKISGMQETLRTAKAAAKDARTAARKGA